MIAVLIREGVNDLSRLAIDHFLPPYPGALLKVTVGKLWRWHRRKRGYVLDDWEEQQPCHTESLATTTSWEPHCAPLQTTTAYAPAGRPAGT